MIKLKKILEKMSNNEENYLEYYNPNIKMKKTYKEIYIDVLKTLTLLQELGVEKNHKIGIVCNNKYEWVLIDLACLFGGYTLVAIHTKDYESKLKEFQSRLDMKIIFIENKLIKGLNEKFKFFEIEKLADAIKSKDEAKVSEFIFSDEDIFTVVFTSGTTGIPKGIGLRVKAIEHTITVASQQFNYTRDDKNIAFLPLSVFTSRLYIYGAFLLDYNLIITTPEMAMSALRIFKPTILQGVPYFFESICNVFFQNISSNFISSCVYKVYDSFKGIMPSNIKKKLHQKIYGEVIRYFGGNMRIMITGMAPISRKVLEFFKNANMNLFESYGLNETGVLALNTVDNCKIGSVGKVLDGYQIDFDEDNQILVKSDYLWSTKYINTESEEKNRIFRDDGVIATGDIGWVDDEGFLYLKGRISDVITLINGQKVHPTVVEKHLNNSLIIKQSMITGNKQPYLVAIIVKNDKNISDKQIRDEIKKKNRDLPDYQKVRDFITTENPFTIENSQLSNNLKLNRSVIFKKYKKQIDKLYTK